MRGFRFRRERVRASRGAAAIEFAITMPILVGMFFFTIEMGNYLAGVHAVMGIAQDSVRYGAKAENFARARVRSQLAAEALLDEVGGLCDGGCTIVTTFRSDGGTTFLHMTLTVPYKSLTGLIPSATGSGAGIVPPQFYSVQAMYPHYGASLLSN